MQEGICKTSFAGTALHTRPTAKGGPASTCTHLQHSHTHTHTHKLIPSLFPWSLGTSWVLFPVASQLYVVTWLTLLTKNTKKAE